MSTATTTTAAFRSSAMVSRSLVGLRFPAVYVPLPILYSYAATEPTAYNVALITATSLDHHTERAWQTLHADHVPLCSWMRRQHFKWSGSTVVTSNFEVKYFNSGRIPGHRCSLAGSRVGECSGQKRNITGAIFNSTRGQHGHQRTKLACLSC